ncbi:LysR family transcriptional regulator [Microvirga guangxiensis]|uniref:DNA-binding transcriptional regulator, LysR family n=1 Tax=Microvirga guangxiensis TaxID=549386 RepID=A0A1G5L397_9HYPH|nr:LysR family transcriptional regulator [Microvirga guangxiensis]SCZ06659.1 DNA-binding transcriptional regulator, LysR family [Microvirga guangxiensis]
MTCPPEPAAFVTVAQLGNFTRAASLLNLSQPALTVRIRNLEESLGVRLFDRNTRTVSLTRIGRELVPALQRILRDLDAVVAQARDLAAQRHGIVRLAALPSFAAGVLPEIIAQFRETNPKISFVIHDVIASEVIAQVREEQVDLGLTGGRIVDPDFEVLHTTQDHMHVVYPVGHSFGDMEQVGVEALIRHPLILMHPPTSVRAVVDAAFLTASRLPVIAAEATYMSTAVGMVRAGLGAAIVPGSAMEVRAEQTLRSRPVDDQRFTREVSIIKKAERTLPASESFARDLIQALQTA